MARKVSEKNKNKKKVSNANELFEDIMNKRQVTYRSVRSWMIRPEHIDDAMAELVSYLWNKYQDNIDELINKYNHPSQWIGFVSLYSRNQLQNLDSAFARKYYQLRNADVSTEESSQEDVIEILNYQKNKNEEVEPRKIYQLDGKYALQLISRLIDSKEAIKQFDDEERTIYKEVYLDNPSKKIPNYAEIARQYDITYKVIMAKLRAMHLWVREELTKLEKSGQLDRHRLGIR